MKLLSVVIPSYNEMANLRKGVLEKVVRYLSKQDFDFELIVVDDGSTDGSKEFVKHFAKEEKKVRLIENSHLGKAGAVTEGVLAAKGDYVLFTDMDQATPIEELTKFRSPMSEGVEVIIGSRSGRKDAPLSRKLMSKANVLLRSIIVGMPKIRDTQCGFKMFRKDAAHTIFTKAKKIHHGFHTIYGSSVTSGFDVELLLIAKKNGYRIAEIPVEWLYVESRRVSPVRDSVDGVLDLLKIRRNMMKGIYG
jgi:dolichyl-phosphate beta-glucosyltransferase